MSYHCPLLPHAPRYRPAIERLYGLKVGTTPVEEGAPHERPYKPLQRRKDLLELAGKSVLLPKDPAFHTGVEGLEWRIRKMSA